MPILGNGNLGTYFLRLTLFCHPVAMFYSPEQVKTNKKRKPTNAPTLKTKIEIITRIETGEITQAQAPSLYQVDASTVSRILKHKDKLRSRAAAVGQEAVKKVRVREGKFAAVDLLVYEWLTFMRSIFNETKLPISAMMLKLQAKKYAKEVGIGEKNFSASNGWLDRWRKRFGVTSLNLHGEGGDVDWEKIKDEMEMLKSLLKNYDLENIYNMDETGLFFRCFPKRSYIGKDENENELRGSKKMVDKSRVTLVVCTNTTGSHKLPILMIGKAKQPECFKYIRACPTPYSSQPSAWMDINQCQKWFDEVFAPEVTRRTRKRVALIWDNCPGHKIVNKHSNIDIFYLPKNSTSRTQPCDQGILRCLKISYKHDLVMKVLDVVENWEERRTQGKSQRKGCAGLMFGYPAHLLDAADLIFDGWQKFSTETIVNCWLKCNVLSEDNHELLLQHSKKYRARYHIPAPKFAVPQPEIDEDQTIGDIMRAMASTRQAILVEADRAVEIPIITRDNLFFKHTDNQDSDLTDGDFQNAVQRWFSIEDEPEVLLEIINEEYEVFEQESVQRIVNEQQQKADAPLQTAGSDEESSLNDPTIVLPSDSPLVPSIHPPAKDAVLTAFCTIRDHCNAKKYSQSLKLLNQLEREFTIESTKRNKQLTLHDMFKKPL